MTFEAVSFLFNLEILEKERYEKVTVMRPVLFLHILLWDPFMIEKIHLERLFQCFVIS